MIVDKTDRLIKISAAAAAWKAAKAQRDEHAQRHETSSRQLAQYDAALADAETAFHASLTEKRAPK